MERYNPFASSNLSDDDPFKNIASDIKQPKTADAKNPSLSSVASQQPTSPLTSRSYGPTFNTDSEKHTATSTSPRAYTTSFPDPFEEEVARPISKSSDSGPSPTKAAAAAAVFQPPPPPLGKPSAPAPAIPNRSNSVSGGMAATSRSVDDPVSSPSRMSRQASGLTSFLSRATSVTSSSVTDRVSGAVGSVRSAVDSISSQIQSAVPTGLGASGTSGEQLQQQQQSAASYFAAKISNQFTSTGPSSGSLPVICRQRVILILDSFASAEWAQQFNNYRRLTSGLSSTPQSALNYLFSATSQLTSGSSGSGSMSSSSALADGSDLVEQADFRDVSVLANQNSSIATIYVTNSRNLATSGSSRLQRQQSSAPRIIRPEYVVVRQRTKDNQEHLRSIVTALNYCLVPLFEPIEVWQIFQDRQLIFSKLLRVQKSLGRENFPLIPQIYFQTHQDLINYLTSGSTVAFPCLVRTGCSGKGKIKIDSLPMLQDFASIMEVGGKSCTLEPFLEVKCDLVVQKMGTSLKLFKRFVQKSSQDPNNLNDPSARHEQQQFSKQSAFRQTSLGSSVLSSLISSASGGSQQQQQSQYQLALARRGSSSGFGPFDRASEVNSRYKSWMEAIAREFDNKLGAFCMKIAVASDDREYIVGLVDSSMDFLGSVENQDEDKRSFVELIISHMNTVLPKNSSASCRQDISGSAADLGTIRRESGEYSPKSMQNLAQSSSIRDDSAFGDKRKFSSQTQIGNNDGFGPMNSSSLKRNDPSSGRAYGQLNNRSKSVTVNQFDYRASNSNFSGSSNDPGFSSHQQMPLSQVGRRSSDRLEFSLTNDLDDSSIGAGDTSSAGLSRQQTASSSLGQSFLDQTSTAFSSFQKQSLSFFKKLDATRLPGDLVSGTPPLSAKSDKAFDRSFAGISNDEFLSGAGGAMSSSGGNITGGVRNGLKSQSIDGSAMPSALQTQRKRPSPPKPPPPQSLGNRQSSLAAYPASQQRATGGSMTTPNSTPIQSRQNSAIIEGSSGEDSKSASSGSQRSKVVRQNSALSAFEPFDPELATQLCKVDSSSGEDPQRAESTSTSQQPRANTLGGSGSGGSIEFTTKKAVTSYDSASITSGDSSGTAEDTMNNLKKTFASIFGEKCE